MRTKKKTLATLATCTILAIAPPAMAKEPKTSATLKVKEIKKDGSRTIKAGGSVKHGSLKATGEVSKTRDKSGKKSRERTIEVEYKIDFP